MYLYRSPLLSKIAEKIQGDQMFSKRYLQFIYNYLLNILELYVLLIKLSIIKSYNKHDENETRYMLGYFTVTNEL